MSIDINVDVDNRGYTRHVPKRVVRLTDRRWAVAYGRMVKPVATRDIAVADLISNDYYEGYVGLKKLLASGIDIAVDEGEPAHEGIAPGGVINAHRPTPGEVTP